MLDRTGDWCFEGGCTYVTNNDDIVRDNLNRVDMEDFYCEPCVGSFD